jgi:hypothetical protein
MGMATPGEVELNLASLREHVPAAIWAEAKSQGQTVLANAHAVEEIIACVEWFVTIFNGSTLEI